MAAKLEIVNSFIQAMSDIFEKMVGMKVTPESPSIKVGNIAYGDFSAIIAMNDAKVSGSVAFSFPQPVIAAVAKSMFQDDKAVSDQELSDLVGELVNMATGFTKNVLQDLDYHFSMSTPELIYGPRHEIHHKVQSQVIMIPFSTDVGRFNIEVCFIGGLFKS